MRWRLQCDFKHPNGHSYMDFHTWLGAYIKKRKTIKDFGEHIEFIKIKRITI